MEISTTPEWFSLWLKCFESEQSGIWADSRVTDGPRIPYIITERAIGPIRARIASGASNAHTPRYDIVNELHDPTDSLSRMMKELDVSALIFAPLSGSSRLLSGAKRQPLKLLNQRAFCESAPYVNCTTTWDEYWTARGKKTRQDWARHERRMLESGFEMVCLHNWEDVQSSLDIVFAVEAAGWKGNAGTAIRQSKATRNFYTGLARYWTESDYLRLFLLKNGHEVAAFQFSGLCDGTLSSLKIGYHPGFTKESPGQVLQLQMLRWAFAQKDVEKVDLLGPTTPQKEKWSTDAEELYSLQVFRRSPLGMIAWGRIVFAPLMRARLTAAWT